MTTPGSTSANFTNASPPYQKDISGWNPWMWAPTLTEGTFIPYATIPPPLLPAKSIWIDSEVQHCKLPAPWDSFRDPWEEFIRWAANGDIVGTMMGLALYLMTLEEKSIGTYGLGEPWIGPRFGYCIGKDLKEQVYVRVEAIKLPMNVYNLSSQLQIVHTSKYRRLYVHHGEITNFIPRSVIGEYILDIGINQQLMYPSKSISFLNNPVNVKIIKQDGTSISVTIREIDANWNLIVAPLPGVTNLPIQPLPGDFFELPEVWCIDDPYLMDGFWYGSEDEIGAPAPTEGKSSGYDLFETSHNKPYIEGVFTGVYIAKNVVDNTTSNVASNVVSSVVSSSNVASSVVSNATWEVSLFSAGIPLEGSDTFKWDFYPLPNMEESEIYSDNKRYEIVSEVQNGKLFQKTYVMDVATDADFTKYISKNNLISASSSESSDMDIDKNVFVRLELDKGGRSSRNNFHAPCLQGSYIKQNGKYFKILAHINGNVVDVAFYSTDGDAILNIFDNNSSASYSIFNQNAWMINQFDMGEERKNIFEGNIVSIVSPTTPTTTPVSTTSTTTTTTTIQNPSTNKVVIEITTSINKPTFADLETRSYNPTYFTNKSFIERFVKTHSHSVSQPKKKYLKGLKWKLHVDGSTYDVSAYDMMVFRNNAWESISANNNFIESFSEEFRMKFGLDYNLNISNVGKNAYITFYDEYEKNGDFNGSLNIGISQGIVNTNTPILCMDGNWLSPSFNLNVAPGEQIGICDGYYFGIDTFALNNDNATVWLTTPYGANGVGSMYNKYNQEGWVLYNDYFTRKLTIRKGRTKFLDNPEKIEMSIGGLAMIESNGKSGTFTFSPDEKQERIKFINHDIPFKNNEGILYYVGNSQNIYGFGVSGKGIVDNQYFRLYNIPSKSSSSYLYEGKPSSPIYTYTKLADDKLPAKALVYFAETTKKPILCSMNLDNFKFAYINENQTIENSTYVDLLTLSDKDILAIYGAPIPESFVLKPAQSTSSSTPTYLENNPEKWKYSNHGIFILGSSNNGMKWGCPGVKSPFQTLNYQYSLLVLNSVNYLASMYDRSLECIDFVCECHDENGIPYLGFYSLSRYDLWCDSFLCGHEKVIKNSTISYSLTDSTVKENYLNFLWRPPCLTDVFMENKDLSFCPKDNLIKDGYSWKVTYRSQDRFVRVVGKSETKSQIESDRIDFGNVNVYLTDEYYKVIFYDDEFGVRMVFSVDGGLSWKQSAVIVAKNGTSGLFMGGHFYFISTSGIVCKYVDGMFLQNIMSAVQGSSSAFVETIQAQVDSFEDIQIGSGQIKKQRLTGYVEKDGQQRLFFYNDENLLCSMETLAGCPYFWRYAPNF